jgi:hypothetical protein
LILRAYGSEATWDDVIRVAITRLLDLATFSRAKAVELDKFALVRDAEGYERDARYLENLGAGDPEIARAAAREVG